MVKRNSGAYTLAYDAENRLTGVTGSATATFVYGPCGERVQGTVNGQTTVYVGPAYELAGQQETIDGFEYTDSPLNHGWSVYAGTGTVQTVTGAGRPGRVLRTTTSMNPATGFGIRYPGDGSSLGKARQQLSVWLKGTNDFRFFVRVRGSNGSDYYLQPAHVGVPVRQRQLCGDSAGDGIPGRQLARAAPRPGRGPADGVRGGGRGG